MRLAVIGRPIVKQVTQPSQVARECGNRIVVRRERLEARRRVSQADLEQSGLALD